MRKVVQTLLIVGGGALAIAGFLQNIVWLASIGGVMFLAGSVIWIFGPTRPIELDGGNRPTHDPINQIGPDPPLP
ncbi:MAG TPA: hypothetical protein VG942_06825 [Hyphomonadaceae bacterium]|nr:hypothetical protein [Hyphomonadaceae bacterium]